MVRRHVTTTLSIVDRERLEHVFSTSVLSLIVSGPSENIIHYIYYILCVYNIDKNFTITLETCISCVF